MKKIFIVTSLFLVIGSCTKEKTSEQTERKEEKVFNELSFEKLKDTKWIIGEVGMNGEMPDTIIFATPNKLAYISTDTGKAILDYSIEKDTITFTDCTFETDMDTEKEIKCNQVNKILFLNTKLKYIYYDQKCSNSTETKRVNLEKENLYFRRIK